MTHPVEGVAAVLGEVAEEVARAHLQGMELRNAAACRQVQTRVNTWLHPLCTRSTGMQWPWRLYAKRAYSQAGTECIPCAPESLW